LNFVILLAKKYGNVLFTVREPLGAHLQAHVATIELFTMLAAARNVKLLVRGIY
jgi:hypothetical protein